MNKNEDEDNGRGYLQLKAESGQQWRATAFIISLLILIYGLETLLQNQCTQLQCDATVN
jgi:hypothetical protein